MIPWPDLASYSRLLRFRYSIKQFPASKWEIALRQSSGQASAQMARLAMTQASLALTLATKVKYTSRIVMGGLYTETVV